MPTVFIHNGYRVSFYSYDLAERIHAGARLAPNVGVPQTWYFPGEAGYIDYPTLAEEQASAPA